MADPRIEQYARLLVEQRVSYVALDVHAALDEQPRVTLDAGVSGHRRLKLAGGSDPGRYSRNICYHGA